MFKLESDGKYYSARLRAPLWCVCDVARRALFGACSSSSFAVLGFQSVRRRHRKIFEDSFKALCGVDVFE